MLLIDKSYRYKISNSKSGEFLSFLYNLIVFAYLSYIVEICDNLNIILAILILILIILCFYNFQTAALGILVMYSILFTNMTTIQLTIDEEPKFEIFSIGGFHYDPELPGDLESLDKIIYSNKSLDLHKCKFCEIKYNEKTHSMLEDLVIAVAVGADERIADHLRNLRTVGCKAKIILFTNIKRFPKDIKNCGIEVAYFKHWKYENRDQTLSLRFYFINHILKNYKDMFERIFYFDLFDTYFQFDPFTNLSTDKNIFYVSPERVHHYSSPYSSIWARDLTGLDFQKISDNEIICSGVFGGGVDAVQKMSMLNSLVIGYKYFTFAADQIVLDWILSTNITTMLNVTVTKNLNFASIHWTGDDYSDDEIGKIRNKKDNIVPSVMHQVNRYNFIESKFQNSCKQ